MTDPLVLALLEEAKARVNKFARSIVTNQLLLEDDRLIEKLAQALQTAEQALTTRTAELEAADASANRLIDQVNSYARENAGLREQLHAFANRMLDGIMKGTP